jgi:hypothetical protein
MQLVSEKRTERLNDFWTKCFQYEIESFNKCNQVVSHTITEIQRNNPTLDSIMFVKHNLQSWSEPAEFLFEPSPIWHDSVRPFSN